MPEPAGSAPDVRLEGVTKRFGDVLAVDDVSLEVERGDFLTLLGPSGCGKTTTLRCIAGFETPTAGTVYIQDRPVNDRSPFERDTSMVFQSYALFPHMTVGENVAFGLQMEVSGDDAGGSGPLGGVATTAKQIFRRKWTDDIERQVTEALELVELSGMADRSVDELSGGQQQRVALARAVVMEPTVLLLDEPLGALDLKLRKNMQVELKNLQEKLGITFVYVTHDQEEALTMSDQIAVMNDGEVVQVGDPNTIYEEPATEFVADFIGETNLIRGDYREDGEGAVVEADGTTFRVPRDPDAEGRVAFAVRPEKIRLGPAATDGVNSFEATVVDEIYKGNLAKFIVRLPSGQQLTVDKQIADQADPLGDNDTLAVSIPPENVVLLTE